MPGKLDRGHRDHNSSRLVAQDEEIAGTRPEVCRWPRELNALFLAARVCVCVVLLYSVQHKCQRSLLSTTGCSYISSTQQIYKQCPLGRPFGKKKVQTDVLRKGRGGRMLQKADGDEARGTRPKKK